MKKLLIQHLIHDYNHHCKPFINPHRVGVVLLERKDLKVDGVYLFVGLPKTLRSFTYRGRNYFFQVNFCNFPTGV